MFETETDQQQVNSSEDNNTLKKEGSVEELSPEASAKAETIARMVEQAKENGDKEALKVLAEGVRNDPELSQALTKRREEREEDEEKQDTEQIDLGKINQALQELNDKFDRIVRLSAQAMEAGAVTESLFTSEEERSNVNARVEALKSAIENATSYDQVQDALNTFTAWYQKSKPIIQDRTRAKVGYFGGSLPDRLRAQVNMFDQLQGDTDNMSHYLNVTKK